MNIRFWKNKNVLITGYEGFLGSALTKRLSQSGANIVGLDIKVHRKETVLDKSDYKKIKVITGSVGDLRLVKRILRDYKIDIVFHLAAEPIVTSCCNNPLRTFDTNIKGTWNILEACRVYEKIKSVIIASSDKAYGEHKDLPYRETFPLLGRHPYDVSKSCADLIGYAYAHTYNLPVAITRCGNIYGPGDFNFSRIIPDTIRCILCKETLLIRSNGKFIRDYVFIEDVVNGYILLAEKMKQFQLAGEAFNFSSESPVAVGQLIRRICRLLEKPLKYKILNVAKFEIRKQYLSSRKAKKVINWKAKYSLERGLKKTIDWYKDYYKNCCYQER